MVCMDAIASSDERRDFEPRGRAGARVLSDSVVSVHALPLSRSAIRKTTPSIKNLKHQR
jgi:hypothetical protein